MKIDLTPSGFKYRKAVLLAIRAGYRTCPEIARVVHLSPTYTSKWIKELCNLGTIEVESDTTTRCRVYRLRENK